MKTVLTFTIAALTFAGCHLEQPFEGPGYSLAEGLLSQAEGPFTVSSTKLFLIDGDVAKKAFDAHIAAINAVFDSQPGLVGSSLGLPIGTDGWPTLSVWESEDDVLAWVVSDVHAAAMDDMADKAKPESSVVSWTMTREELETAPPTWEDAKARLAADGRQVY